MKLLAYKKFCAIFWPNLYIVRYLVACIIVTQMFEKR